MKLCTTVIPGCFEIEYVDRADARGTFVKTFHATAFRELGLESTFTEGFYSVSAEGVLRGMHFQLPPADGAKLVCCLKGEVLDVALYLRVGSPAFGKAVSFRLGEGRASAAYIPRGVAHGFLTMRGPATIVYNISSEYNRQLDTGIRWDSFGMDWPNRQPQLSPRDRTLPALAEFDSPFRFDPKEIAV